MSFARLVPLIFLMLSACAGSSGDGSTPESVAQTVGEAIAALSDVGAAPATMPTSGSARYTGYATAFVKDTITDQVGRQLVGNAIFTATFDASGGTVDGRLTDLLGKRNVNQTELFAAIQNGHAGDIEDVLADYTEASGDIALSNGDISGDRFEARIDGTIRHEGAELRFDGRGDGSFSGDDAAGVQFTGIAGGSGNMTLTEDNALRAGTLAVVAAQ